MPTQSLQDRAVGALMGAFIGDALALGPHWYYDLDELRADYGDWISDYTDPRPGRYHAGLKAGQASQAGVLLALTLDSLVARGGYDEADFCRRMDDDFFPLIDGTPMAGPGGYTSQSIREAWRRRVGEGLPWGQCGGNADTTEAAERGLAIAVRYALRPAELAAALTHNTLLTQTDGTVVAMTVAYGAVLGMLVEGHALDGALSGKLMARVKQGDAVPELVALRPQPDHFGAAHFELLVIIAPGEQTAGAGNGQCGKHQEAAQRQPTGHPFTHQPALNPGLPHEPYESQPSSHRKGKLCQFEETASSCAYFTLRAKAASRAAVRSVATLSRRPPEVCGSCSRSFSDWRSVSSSARFSATSFRRPAEAR